MILINKNQEPKEWTEYCSTPGVTYQSIPELVDALLKEQGYICAYCMRRIPTKDKIEGKLTSEDHRIEHIKCRENHEDLQLKYNNMLICCPGHIGEDEHCDRKKGNQEISFSPLDSAFINTLTYTSNGIIASSNPVYNEEINSILNLNTPFLVLNRKNMLKSFPKGGEFMKKEELKKELLKVKQMNTCDLQCTAIEEGEGKYAGVLGKIVCNYKGYELRVGSGFTDEQRAYYWKNPWLIVGSIVEIQYFEESNNEQGGLSLRFPVFKRVRDDKDEESYE